jgi:ABC-type lipopolysaccharide export system ATPase subunit
MQTLSLPLKRNDMETQLSAQGLKKSFNGRAVVKGVSLEVKQGEVVGLLGPNGAGKTTSFYMIVGLIPADEGNIELCGEVITKESYSRASFKRDWLSPTRSFSV